MAESGFEGFPKEGLQFLAELRQNNRRDWFKERKQTYLDTIVAPAVLFVQEMGERLRYISPHIQFDTRANGQGSLMRIYRDLRFAKDKSPYRTWIGIRFWEGGPKAARNPGFFFGFDDTAGGLHVGLHGFDKGMLSAYRAAVDDDQTGGELEMILADVREAGPYMINGEHYKGVPRGYDKDHPRADLLRYNALYVSSPAIEPEALTSPELVETVMDHCGKTAVVQQWLVKVKLANAN